MKKTCLALFLNCIVTFAFAQMSSLSYDHEDFVRFKGNKLLFVKSGNENFDKSAEAALADSWKVTPYEVIEQKDFEKRISDPSVSFMSLILIGANDRGYHYLAVFNGGEKRLSNYTYEDMVAYSPVSRWTDEPELIDCAWRVRNMIEAMVQAIDIVQKNNIKGNTLKIVNELRDYYNKKSPQIKQRTLLVSETSMGRKFEKSDITSNYPFKVEVVPRSKIEKAIQEKSKDYYYLQPGITLNKIWMVVDPSNGEVMYLNYAVMGININEKDIKDLVEKIKGN